MADVKQARVLFTCYHAISKTDLSGKVTSMMTKGKLRMPKELGVNPIESNALLALSQAPAIREGQRQALGDFERYKEDVPFEFHLFFSDGARQTQVATYIRDGLWHGARMDIEMRIALQAKDNGHVAGSILDCAIVETLAFEGAKRA